MRIMHILNHTRRLNGNVHAAIDLACAQAARNDHVVIVSGGGDFDKLLSLANVDVIVLDQERKPITILKSLLRLRRLVKEIDPTVVHAHMMTSAVLSFVVCRLCSVPLITTVHNAFERSAVLMGLGSRVIAVSEAVKTSMRRRGIMGSRIDVVLNGTIGSVRMRGRDDTVKTLSRPSILFVGGLHPRKGLPDLLKAFAAVHPAHPRARLYVIGGGPFDQAYREMAQETGCGEAIEFVGAIDQPFPYMQGADIFVLPSHADPAPLVLSEAREAGCAVIGTEVDGIPQLLGYGEAGILIPPRDPQAIANALNDLLADPASLALWKARSQRNLGLLSIERVVDETMKVYLSAVSRRNADKAMTAGI